MKEKKPLRKYRRGQYVSIVYLDGFGKITNVKEKDNKYYYDIKNLDVNYTEIPESMLYII